MASKGYQTTEVYVVGSAGAALAAALTACINAGMDIAAAGCALGLGIAGGMYALARGSAKRGA